MADFSTWPLGAVPLLVRGTNSSTDTTVDYHVDDDGILHVTVKDDGNYTELAFRLVQVEQTWVEVDRG